MPRDVGVWSPSNSISIRLPILSFNYDIIRGGWKYGRSYICGKLEHLWKLDLNTSLLPHQRLISGTLSVIRSNEEMGEFHEDGGGGEVLS